MRCTLIILCCAMLAGCSGSLQRQVMGERSITPKEVAQQPIMDTALVIEWGGVIAQTENLASTTEIEIIAYPLQDNGRPDLDEPPSGRFIAIIQGFLEPADHRPGRSITLSGNLSGVRQGKVGKADYRFPLLEPVEMQLWPAETVTEPKSRWHFGIGVGSGGSRGSVGVGLGL